MQTNIIDNRTLIIGLGNTILSDDGAGILVAREIKKRRNGLKSIDIVEASLGGIGLIDLMADYNTVIIVDSIKTENGSPGTFYKLNINDLGDTAYPCSSHLLDLRTTIELGKKMGYNMPESIDIYAIEIRENTTFSESLSPEVEKAIPELAKKIVEELILI
jgi:hydrogenase maturation protease